MNRPALQRADSPKLSCSREATDVFVDQASLGSSAVRGPSRSVEPPARTGSVDRDLTRNPHRLNQFRCQAVSVQRRQPNVSTGGPSRRGWLYALGETDPSQLRVQALPLPSALGQAVSLPGTVEPDRFRRVVGCVR